MCSRHLPRSQPLTTLQAIQYVKPSRRLPKTALLASAPILSVSGQFQPPATYSMYFAAVSRSLGSSQLHCARDFQPGLFGISATASVPIMILTTLGEAARHPRHSAPCLFLTRVC